MAQSRGPNAEHKGLQTGISPTNLVAGRTNETSSRLPTHEKSARVCHLVQPLPLTGARGTAPHSSPL
jgi:hypothetical protein